MSFARLAKERMTTTAQPWSDDAAVAKMEEALGLANQIVEKLGFCPERLLEIFENTIEAAWPAKDMAMLERGIEQVRAMLRDPAGMETRFLAALGDDPLRAHFEVWFGQGLALERRADGNWRLRGDGFQGDYAMIRRQWLQPNRRQIATALEALNKAGEVA